MRAYLGLGSNLGDRENYLLNAISSLRELDADLAISPVYETAPVGGPGEQEAFLNCVVSLETTLDPSELLEFAQSLEKKADRVRTIRWGPRTLDVDLLYLEGVILATAELTVPHPRMYERAFVLAPLEDLDPALVPTNWREALGGEDVVRADVRRVGTFIGMRLVRSPEPVTTDTEHSGRSEARS